MEEKFIKNTELAIEFHRSLIKRARWWGFASTILTVVLFSLAYFLDFIAGKEFYVGMAALIIPTVGWSWAWKEIYDFQKRIDAVNFFKRRYVGPPNADEKEKEVIVEAFEKIIDRNY